MHNTIDAWLSHFQGFHFLNSHLLLGIRGWFGFVLGAGAVRISLVDLEI
jgi:hypothetical protein